ncbi:MAG: AtpZ/AtpI family protein [Deltaproteobacteria bacterium]|nr:AtpZ/AtpI family protein [Deltaproteobacteria bacterium]
MICPLPRVTWLPAIDTDSKLLWRQAGQTGAVGLEIAIAIAIGYFGGRYLDGKLHTTPWLTWIGFGAGIGAAIKALVRVTRQYMRQQAQDDNAAPLNQNETHDPPTDQPH